MKALATLVALALSLPAAASAAGKVPAPAEVVRTDGTEKTTDWLVVDETIVADGPVELVSETGIVVRGRIVAPHGAAGSDGADVVLKAPVIVVEPGAVVASGDGGDATSVRGALTAQAPDGGDGGDITIHATTVTIDGVLRLGNGGRGGNATAMTARAGDGGAAGDLHFFGSVESIERHIEPGRGGDGGDATSLPAPAAASNTEAACPATLVAGQPRAGNPAKPGKASGDGETGTSVTSQGGDGIAGPKGGNGTGGAPGSFGVVFSGSGTAGQDGCQGGRGGDGATAQAIGGDGGDSALGTGGAGGDATALGGDGGIGGQGGTGGTGGRGGPATIGPAGDGGPGGNGGPGGQGGNGGDACAQGGAGGSGPSGVGAAGNATATPGAAGEPGPAGEAGRGGVGGTSLLGVADGATGPSGQPGTPGTPGLPGAVIDAPCIPAVEIATDPYTAAPGQHRTLVEPDSFAHGSTVVTAFQVSRIFDGGGNNVGFSTSNDGGGSWTSGMLPSITFEEGGPWARASDPVVAYNARDGVWLIQTLGLTSSPVAGRVVLVSRSTDDGRTWSAPVTVAGGPSGNLDKNWIVCDNWPSSPYYGNCYSTWDDHGAGNRMEINTSTNGGLSWGPVMRPADNAGGLGGVPVVQPDGKVVVPYQTGWSQLRAFTSTNGGTSWGSSFLISSTSFHQPPGLRAPPLPSSEIAADGTIYVAWHDCRFRTSCSANDIVMTSSANGTTWGPVVRVPISATNSGSDHFLPGLAVDVTTSGPSTRLFVVYYSYPQASCTSSTCALQVGYGTSGDAGATWTFSNVGSAFPLSWIANTTQGRMVGDYFSASFVPGGRAVPVWSHAYAPDGATFNQNMQTIMGGVEVPATGTVRAVAEMPAPGAFSLPPADALPTLR